MVVARQAHRQVGEDQVVHAEAGKQAVGRREVTAQLPFPGIGMRRSICPHYGQSYQA